MKRTQFLVLSLLAFGLQGIAHASPFPADAEASFDMSSLDESAAVWGVGPREVKTQASPYPADAEASFDMSSLGESAGTWGVGKREAHEHDPFPVGNGFIAE